MPDRGPLGTFLRAQRRSRGWSQLQLVFKLRDLGVHIGRGTVSKYECGGRLPKDTEVLQAFATLFERDVKELIALDSASRHGLADQETVDRIQQKLSTSAREPEARASLDKQRSPAPNPDQGQVRRPSVPRHLPALVLALAVGLALLAVWQPTSPTTAKVIDGQLVALRGQRELWAVSFGELGDGLISPLVRDVTGDGRADVLFAYPPPYPEVESGRIYCYTASGHPCWDPVPLGRPQTIGSRKFEIYVPARLDWIETPDAAYLLAIARHFRYYPTQVLLLDPATGTIVSEYWHPGYIQASLTCDLDADGTTELILGGVNNPEEGPGHPILLVLDLPFRAPTGEPNFFGPMNSRERTYLVLPRPDVADIHTNLAAVRTLERSPQGLTASVAISNSDLLFYEFDTHLDLTGLYPSDYLIHVHDQLAAAGELDHRFTTEERDSWRAALVFPTAPDANSPAIRFTAQAP